MLSSMFTKKWVKSTWWWLIIIIVVGGVIRIPEFFAILGSEELMTIKIIWYDEAYSSYFAQHGLGDVVRLSGVDSTPMFFYLLLWVWQKIAGLSVVLLALLPFVFSVAAIPVVYLLGKQIFNHKTGLWAAWFFCISALNVDYATELRAYSLLVLLTSLSMLFWWRLRDKKSWKNLLGYILFSLLVMYTHYTGFALVGAQALLMFLYWKKDRLKTIGVHLLIALMYVPQLFLFQRWSDIFGNKDILMVPYFSRAFSHGDLNAVFGFFYSIVFGQFAYYYLWTGFFGLLVFGGYVYLLKRKWSDVKLRCLLLMPSIGFVLLAALKFIYAPKYFIVWTIPVCLILAYLINSWTKRRYQHVFVVGVSFVLLIFVIFGYQVSEANQHMYYAKSLFAEIEKNELPGDVVLTDHFNNLLMPWYYDGQAQEKFFFPDEEVLSRWRYWDYNIVNQDNVVQLDELIEGVDRVWSFDYWPQGVSVQDPSGLVKERLVGQYKIIKSFEFPEDELVNQKIILNLYQKNDNN